MKVSVGINYDFEQVDSSTIKATIKNIEVLDDKKPDSEDKEPEVKRELNDKE